jgi:glycosyltransferase involved in cell wall biosynthesis
MMAISSSGSFALIIPVYNHEGMVREVVEKALALSLPVFVVDDGSTDGSYGRIEDIPEIRILRHPENRGKGAALLTGFAEAARVADWAVTLDADGQHDPAEVPAMIRAIPGGTRPIVIGRRRGMAGPAVPWTSRFGRGFSNFWVRMSGGPTLSDTQSGFRIYPLPETLRLDVRARRYQFEVELLAKAHWAGIPVTEAEIGVDYRPGSKRISHFHPFVDFMRNTLVFARLIPQRLFVPPSVRARWAMRPGTPP